MKMAEMVHVRVAAQGCQLNISWKKILEALGRQAVWIYR